MVQMSVYKILLRRTDNLIFSRLRLSTQDQWSKSFSTLVYPWLKGPQKIAGPKIECFLINKWGLNN